MDNSMDIYKSPYSDDAAALREHERLVAKGRQIAAILERNRRATSLEYGVAWSTPEQAPYDARSGFDLDVGAYPGRMSDKTGGSK